MIIYRFRPDMVYDCEVEVPDDTVAIPRYHTFQAPPVQEGYYALMRGGWILIEGEKPIYPPPPPPVDPVVEAQKLKEEILRRTQERLDEFANTRQYNGILSLCSYASSTVLKFQMEGEYGIEVRDATWVRLYELLAEMDAGIRTVNSYEDIESELPTLQWPL